MSNSFSPQKIFKTMSTKRKIIMAVITVSVIAVLAIIILWASGVFKNRTSAPSSVGSIGETYVLYPNGSYKSLSTKDPAYMNTPGTEGVEQNAQYLVNQLFLQQQHAEFERQRVCLLLYPGTHTINIKLGYYTSVAGLGLTPDEVHVNGTISAVNNANPCIGALDNFFRSISNLTINVPPGETNYFRTSQASPLRDLVVNGNLGVAQHQFGCVEDLGGFSSGGYMHNVKVSNELKMETQQQFLTQNCSVNNVSGGAWNLLFMGCEGTITPIGKPISIVDATPGLSAPAPRLVYDILSKTFLLLRPNMLENAKGLFSSTDVTKEPCVFVDPSMTIEQINGFLDKQQNIVFLPGQYYYSKPVTVSKPGTIVMGIGYATINPTSGNVALLVKDEAYGVRLCGLMIEAGQIVSEELVLIGEKSTGGNSMDPTILYDIFPRVGGPTDSASAKTMMKINQSHCTVMHTWLWRSDHTDTIRSGLGVDKAVCEHALVVNGDGVRLFGLFAEHTLKEGIVWNGNQGMVQFLQSEMAYDVVKPWDYPMLTVNGNGFVGNALGVYSFFSKKFNKGDPSKAPSVTQAILSKDNANANITNACTVFLNASDGAGSINSVWNGQGNKSDVSNADVPQWI